MKETVFSTSVYRKKISSGLFTQFNSFTPMRYKIGFVRCFTHRPFKISSSYITPVGINLLKVNNRNT